MSAFDPRLEATGLKFALTIGLAAYPEDALRHGEPPRRAPRRRWTTPPGPAPGRSSLYGALAEADLGDAF